MKRFLLLLFLLISLLSIKNIYLGNMSIENKVKANTTQTQTKNNNATIKHFVKDNALYVECWVPFVTFSDVHSKQAGKIEVSVDGLPVQEFHSAAFVVKDIKSGVHQITIKVTNINQHRTKLVKKFYITVV